MARQRRTVDLSASLWNTLEVMSRDMSVDVDSLLNQAVFTFARFNGYATPGPVTAEQQAPDSSQAVASSAVDDMPPGPAVVDGPVTDVEPGYFSDERAIQVRGARKDDDWSGDVALLDSNEVVLHQRSLGLSAVEAHIVPLLVDEAKEPASWLRQHSMLAGAGQIGEATLALVRAVGSGATAETFTLWAHEHTMPLVEAVASDRAERAQAILQEMHGLGATVEAKATFLTDELRQGSHPATVLKLLALELQSANALRPAADVIRCAKALDPLNRGLYLPTQAVLELELGRIDAVRLALDEVAHDEGSPEVAALRHLAAVLFPTYDFWPKHDGVAALDLESASPAGVRDLPALRVAVQKAATRLMSLRERLRALHPKATWLPPELSQLLPKGPLPLQGDDALQLSDQGTVALLTQARAEWAGLCWLCWLGGLDEVALPGRSAKLRSPAPLRYALGLRQMVLDLLMANESLDEHLEGAPLRHAQAVAEVPYVGVPLGSLAARVAEVALAEVNGVLLPVLWAEESVRTSAWQPESASQSDDDGPAAEPESTPPEPESEQEASASVETGAVVLTDSLEVWLEREGEPVQHLRGQRRYVFGREATCDVVLASPRVSREHAELVADAQARVVLNDLGSSNGTFFEGERITERLLVDGDEVTFGNEVVRFFFSEPT